jgi:hypothetical protein
VSDLTPSAGARFLLERQSADERAATYLATIATPGLSYAYDVALAAGDEPVLTARGEPAPPELAGMLVMLARLTARGVDKRLADGLPPWPERVTRWRGPGRGG